VFWTLIRAGELVSRANDPNGSAMQTVNPAVKADTKPSAAGQHFFIQVFAD
jgi:hypothetical protein